jgi:hypothetical protein
MNRSKFVWLCVAILGASATAQMSVSVPNDPESAAWVARVQSIPVSQLEKDLPDVNLQDWLSAEAGPDAKVGWGHTPPYMGLCWNNTMFSHCGCSSVDASVKTWDGRQFFVQIAVGYACAVPAFDAGMVAIRKGHAAFIRRLSDLPHVLWRNPDETRHIEGTR